MKFDNLQEEERVEKANEFKKNLSLQQGIFAKMDSVLEEANKAICVISQIIAERMKHFPDAEYVKECLNAVVEVAYREKKSKFNF